MSRYLISGAIVRLRRRGQLVGACCLCAFAPVGAAAQTTADPGVADVAADESTAQGEVAATESDASPTEAPVGDAPLARPEAQMAFRRLIREEDFAGAVEYGERLLDLALEESGTQSSETGQALYELGDVQRRAGMFEEAELSFLNAIEIFRAIDGPFSPLTIDPSIGLGDTYSDDGQYVNAIAAYNEAKTIQRRTFGLLTEDQLPVMDRMTRAFQAMSMHEEAEEQQQNAVLLVERIHGQADVETLEAIYKYAAWLRSASRYDLERDQYERALRIIRSEYDKDHPLLVRPYREIGNSWREQGLESPRGFSALNSAREVLEMQSNPDPLELAATIVDIGDWKTAFGPAGSGHEDYLTAWNLLGSTAQENELRTTLFQPRRAQTVFAERMSVRGLAQDPNESGVERGYVLMQFDIDPYGRTQNVEVLESEPPGFKDDAAARSVRLSRFRPRIEAGQFVTARRQGYRISYRYVPDD